jgi:2-polyprenyl-3-methyl-5-hydroxy-6-metoxy-1,4-benzoquinol methylase
MSAKPSGFPYPTIEQQAAYFDSWNVRCRAKAFDEIDANTKAGAQKILEMLHSLQLTQPAILEVGCGTGWLTERLVDYGETIAIDLSPRAIEIAKHRRLSATFIAGDLCKQDFPLTHFDVVILPETISCIPNQAVFVDKIASVLKLGGYLILSSLNKFVFDRRSDLGPRPQAEVSNWPSRKGLHQLLKSEFRILKSVTVLPMGDKGLLRIVNSYKCNSLLRLFIPKTTIDWAKEKLGLGHMRVILAQRVNC